MREQPIGEAVEDDDWASGPVMWPPETEIEAPEVHASLVKAVAGSRGVRFFKTHLYGVPDDIPLGGIQIAIDETAGEACGIYLTARIAGFDAATGDPILTDEATEPFKFRYLDDIDKAISTFSENLGSTGIIPWARP